MGYNLLGPIIHRWLLALHQYIQFLDDGNTSFLFCARAGVRIRKLYNIFLRGFPFDTNIEPELFWISRIAVAKGVFKRQRKRALELIAREYHHHPLSRLVEGLFRHQPGRLANLDLYTDDLKAHGFNLSGWLTVKSPAQDAVNAYLSETSKAFENYIAEVLNGNSRAVLIDSGWQGSAQGLLSHSFTEVQWKGLYFGRILTEHHDSAIVPDVIGLMFERNAYDPDLPESAFVRHRHLIECILSRMDPQLKKYQLHLSPK